MSLPRLNFSTLSHNAAKWPLPGKALLGCALAGFVWVVGDSVLLSPSRERLHALEVQGAALQQHLSEKTSLSARLEARVRQFELAQAKAAQLSLQLAGEGQVPGLLEDLSRLAVANGLAVESVTVLDERPQPFFVEQPLQVAVSGAFHDMAAFVKALGQLPRMVTVHDVSLRTDGAALRLELLAKIYRNAAQGADNVGPVGRLVDASAVLRDPFRPPALQPGPVIGRPASAPDFSRERSALESVAVDQFEMVGTLSRGVQNFALLRAASSVHRLAVGDYLGPNHGRITAIHDNRVELAELFPDEQGAWLERPRTLVLNVNS